MNLSAGPLVHLICLPADGTVAFYGDHTEEGAEKQKRSAVAYSSHLLALNNRLDRHIKIGNTKLRSLLRHDIRII